MRRQAEACRGVRTDLDAWTLDAQPVALGRKMRRARFTGAASPWSARIGELDRPALLLAGIDLEKAVAVEAAGQAILDTSDGEFTVPRAHERAAAPFAAAVVVHGVNVIETGRERSLE